MLEPLFHKEKACNFIKKRSVFQHKCFPMNIAKIFKNPCFEEHLPKTASGYYCGDDFKVLV